MKYEPKTRPGDRKFVSNLQVLIADLAHAETVLKWQEGELERLKRESSINFDMRFEIVGPNCLGERECDGEIGEVVGVRKNDGQLFYALSSETYPAHVWGMVFYPASSLRLVTQEQP